MRRSGVRSPSAPPISPRGTGTGGGAKVASGAKDKKSSLRRGSGLDQRTTCNDNRSYNLFLHELVVGKVGLTYKF
jgi:hypothetical protein